MVKNLATEYFARRIHLITPNLEEEDLKLSIFQYLLLDQYIQALHKMFSKLEELYDFDLN